MNVTGADPNLLAGVDPARQARSQTAHGMAGQKLFSIIGGFRANWSIIPFAHAAWAQAMFPGLPEAEVVDKLWDAVFMATRIDDPDPLANWRAHAGRLRDRAAFLNEQRFDALKFNGPGTDLKVGLIEGHVWVGGARIPPPASIACRISRPRKCSPCRITRGWRGWYARASRFPMAAH